MGAVENGEREGTDTSARALTLSSCEVAEILGCTERTVRNLARAGVLSPVENPVAVRRRFDLAEVTRFAEFYIPRTRPHWRAIQRLIAAHRDEYRRLVEAS